MSNLNLTPPTIGQPNSTEDVDIVNAFNAIQTWANGNIDTTNVTAAFQALLHSPGDIKASARSTPETGWLACDGTAVSRSTYASLFSAIGTNFGTGDGTSTFNVPDLRGRAPVGKGTHTDVDTIGESDGAAVGSRTPKHTHSTTTDGTHSHSTLHGYTEFTGSFGVGAVAYLQRADSATFTNQQLPTTDSGAHSHTANASAGGYVVVNYFIRT
jgi:microcystin-dependent protein